MERTSDVVSTRFNIAELFLNGPARVKPIVASCNSRNAQMTILITVTKMKAGGLKSPWSAYLGKKTNGTSWFQAC